MLGSVCWDFQEAGFSAQGCFSMVRANQSIGGGMMRRALMAETRIKGTLLAFGLLGAIVPFWAPPNSILAQAAVILCVGVLLLSIFEWALPADDEYSGVIGNPWFWLFFCGLFEGMYFFAIYPYLPASFHAA